MMYILFFKQKTAYVMRISDWSSDVCSSDLLYRLRRGRPGGPVLLWGHANGFAAGSYLPLLEELCEDFRVFAFDARGHGGSQQPPAPFGRTLHLDRYNKELGLHVGRVRECTADTPTLHAPQSFSDFAPLRLRLVRATPPWRGVVQLQALLMPPPDTLASHAAEHPNGDCEAT